MNNLLEDLSTSIKMKVFHPFIWTINIIGSVVSIFRTLTTVCEILDSNRAKYTRQREVVGESPTRVYLINKEIIE